jgi:hypothetical protein
MSRDRGCAAIRRLRSAATIGIGLRLLQRALEELQDEPSIGVAPSKGILRRLDYMHGKRGRIIYDCPPPEDTMREYLRAKDPCEITGLVSHYSGE